MGKLIVALLAVVISVGCAERTQPIQHKHANMRVNFKDNMKSALVNMIKEAKTSSNEAISGAISAIQSVLGRSDSNPIDSIDPDFLNGLVDKIFDSEVAKAIFAETNITSQTDTQVAYGLGAELCDKISAFAGGSSGDLVDTCKQFFENNAVEIRVTKLEKNTLELALWHAPDPIGDRATFPAPAKQFVLGLSTSPNSIGVRFSLGGTKNFVVAVMNQVRDPNATRFLSAIKKLAGALSVQLRFKSTVAESDCKDGSPLCLMVNVDEDIDVMIGDEDDPLSLAFAKSPIEKPTVAILAGADGAFKGSFNLGAFDLKFGKGTAGGLVNLPSFHLSLESSSFDVSLPKDKDSDAFMILVENFKSGKNPSYFEGFGKKIMVDLANESRSIEKIKVAMQASKALFDLSPLSLIVSMSDETNDQCKIVESLKLTSDKNGTTQIAFTGFPGSHFRGNGNHSKDMCNESSLFAFPFWGMLRVGSGAACDAPMALKVNQGSFEMTYMYNLNGAGEKSMTLAAAQDQCLRVN